MHEIVDVKNQPVAYYVGMTGDNHYPSARSPFHRLAGHFDRAAKSTQRQLSDAIEDKLGDLELANLTIKMHYYPISGFVPIEEAINKMGPDHFTAPRFAEALAAYRLRHKEVLGLENYVISLFRGGDVLFLNKTFVEGFLPVWEYLLGVVGDLRGRFLV